MRLYGKNDIRTEEFELPEMGEDEINELIGNTLNERIVKEDIAGLHIFALNKYDDVADIYKASVLTELH